LLGLGDGLVTLGDGVVRVGYVRQGMKEKSKGYRYRLMGLRDGLNTYAVRCKPYEEKVKEMLKWRFLTQNGCLSKQSNFKTLIVRLKFFVKY